MRFLTEEELAERERRRGDPTTVVTEAAPPPPPPPAATPDGAPPPQEVEVQIANHLWRPPEPKTFEDAGLTPRVLEGLILRTFKQRGIMTFQQVADALHVNIGVVDEMLRDMRDRKAISDLKPLHFDLTSHGHELCDDLERVDAYVGPAPVPFDQYCDLVEAQSQHTRRVSEEEVLAAFEGYALRPELVKVLKEGFNSNGCLFFYGPPGNGKTLLTAGLHRLLDEDPTILPHAIEFNGRIVRYYDPAYHQTWGELMAKEEAEAVPPETISPYDRSIYLRPDRRWLISHAPLVIVGTEFRVDHFEIAYDTVYDAPPHVKANNGVFIFDDLGRQTQDHNMILNQFIYPLESAEAIVKFAGGSSMRVPYRQRLFLSTNLNKDDIIDDAFRRRLLYQIHVERPTRKLWRRIFRLEAEKAGLTNRETVTRWCSLLLTWWERDGRVLRACDPRNLFVMIRSTLGPGETLEEHVTHTDLERVYWQYPAGFVKDQPVYGRMANEERIRQLVGWGDGGQKQPPDWSRQYHTDAQLAWAGDAPDYCNYAMPADDPNETGEEAAPLPDSVL